MSHAHGNTVRQARAHTKAHVKKGVDRPAMSVRHTTKAGMRWAGQKAEGGVAKTVAKAVTGGWKRGWGGRVRPERYGWGAVGGRQRRLRRDKLSHRRRDTPQRGRQGHPLPRSSARRATGRARQARGSMRPDTLQLRLTPSFGWVRPVHGSGHPGTQHNSIVRGWPFRGGGRPLGFGRQLPPPN